LNEGTTRACHHVPGQHAATSAGPRYHNRRDFELRVQLARIASTDEAYCCTNWCATGLSMC
jgi:hypothetical protein